MNAPARPAPPPAPLLLFDGDCALCQGATRAFLRLDRRGRLRYAPIGGVTAAPIFARHHADPAHLLSSVWLVERTPDGQERLLTKSEAVLTALTHISPWFRPLAFLARLVPLAGRNAVYDFIAANRYHWFGKAACALPTPAQRQLLLP